MHPQRFNVLLHCILTGSKVNHSLFGIHRSFFYTPGENVLRHEDLGSPFSESHRSGGWPAYLVGSELPDGLVIRRSVHRAEDRADHGRIGHPAPYLRGRWVASDRQRNPRGYSVASNPARRGLLQRMRELRHGLRTQRSTLKEQAAALTHGGGFPQRGRQRLLQSDDRGGAGSPAARRRARTGGSQWPRGVAF